MKKLTKVTKIARFVSIDGTTIIRISRYRDALGYDTPVVSLRRVWGTCLDDMPDTFFVETGEFQDVLKTIAPQEMVAAAALASPRPFAEMVAAAYDLGGVFYVGSNIMWTIADRIGDAKRFCAIEANGESLNFHILVQQYTREQREPPGVYRVSFSLLEFAIQSRVLVEEYPKQSQIRQETLSDEAP